MTSHLSYSTSTEAAAERARREREGILLTCSQCEKTVRWYVAEAPKGEILCGRCEDWG